MIANDTPAARRAAYRAMESAKVPLSTACESCGSTKDLHRHHDDYAKPLDVRCLCRSCHIKHHVALRKAAGTYKPGGRRKASPSPKKRAERRAAA